MLGWTGTEVDSNHISFFLLKIGIDISFNISILKFYEIFTRMLFWSFFASYKFLLGGIICKSKL